MTFTRQSNRSHVLRTESHSQLELDFNGEFDSPRRASGTVDSTDLFRHRTRLKSSTEDDDEEEERDPVVLSVKQTQLKEPSATPSPMNSPSPVVNRTQTATTGDQIKKLPLLFKTTALTKQSTPASTSPSSLRKTSRTALPNLIRIEAGLEESPAPNVRKLPVLKREEPEERKRIPKLISIRSKETKRKTSLPTLIKIEAQKNPKLPPLVPITGQSKTAVTKTQLTKIKSDGKLTLKKIKLFRGLEPTKLVDDGGDSDSSLDEDSFVDADDFITVRDDDIASATENHDIKARPGISDDSPGDTLEEPGPVEKVQDALEPQVGHAPSLQSLEEEEISKDDQFYVRESQVQVLRTRLLSQLNSRATDRPPYALENKITELQHLIGATVLKSEKNSCFLFGARSSGRTSAINTALERVRQSMAPENRDFLLIKVSGSACPEDKMAIRAIAEQLDSEIARIYGVDLKELETSEFLARKSISATFANILTILDTPVTLDGRELGRIENSIVLIIDDVDVYANQGRQTLLYNLFELVENSNTPICVLCCTSKFTMKESLEKRVRSRFSQRTLTFEKLGREDFIKVATKILKVDSPQNDYELEFNRKVDELLDYSSELRRLIVYNHLTVANIKQFMNHCIYPASRLSRKQPFLRDGDFAKYAQNLNKASLRNTIQLLSDLECFLLVSAARVITKKDLSWVNLNLVYEEYTFQIKARNREVTSSTGGLDAVTTTGHKVWTKDSCKAPWEMLQTLGLLTMPTNSFGINRVQEFGDGFETRMWNVEVVLDELRLVVEAENPAKAWTRL